MQNLNYAWNAVGSLTSRQDANQSLTETFAYDNIHRLDYSQLNGNTNLDLSYQANGNISWRSDVGSYTYHGTKIHAVTAAGGLSFSYDANGNLTTRSGASVTWYASNQPQTISNGSYSSTFEYGPNRHYWKQTATYSNGTETTRYIGGLLEIVQGPSVTSWRHQILAAGRTVAVYSRGSNGSNNTIYPLRDHLGSTEAVTNASGGIIVKTSFAAYGARRASNWTGSPSGAEMSAIGDATRRGYTDHTMLDNWHSSVSADAQVRRDDDLGDVGREGEMPRRGSITKPTRSWPSGVVVGRDGRASSGCARTSSGQRVSTAPAGRLPVRLFGMIEAVRGRRILGIGGRASCTLHCTPRHRISLKLLFPNVAPVAQWIERPPPKR